MNFDSYIPTDNEAGEDAQQYANHVTIDGGGVDLVHFGETISGSFNGQNPVEIALAVMEESFTHTDGQVHLTIRMGGYTPTGMEDLGYSYLKAAQLMRQKLEVPELAA